MIQKLVSQIPTSDLVKLDINQYYTKKEVNKLIRELSNSRPLGLQDTKYRRVTPSLRAVPYPSSPFVCDPGSSNYFPGWG